MHKTALVWACLACLSWGQHTRTAVSQVERSAHVESQQPVRASGSLNPLQSFARALLAQSAAAAFKPLTPGARLLRAAAPEMRSPQVPYKYPAGAGFRYDTTMTSWINVFDRIIRERIVFVSGYMNDDTANYNVALLLYLQNEDASLPVNMYCNVGGGLAKSGLAMYDAMRLMPFDIQTLNMGVCGDVGAFIVAAGTQGQRIALPNSLFAMRSTRMDPPVDEEGNPQMRPMQATEMQVEVEEVLRDRARMMEGFSRFTGKSEDELLRDFGRDFYLTASEAKEYGLVDKILTSKRSVLTP